MYAQQWTSGLGFKIKDGWRSWTVLDQVCYLELYHYPCIVHHTMLQVAGYVTEYEENDFTFVTVKGAGHQVCCALHST